MARVLILTAHSGGGHISLAKALTEMLPPGMSATTVDPLPPSAHQHYRLVSRYALWMWAAEFHGSNTPARALAFHRVLDLLLGRRLDDLLQQHQPALVLSTCAPLTEAVTRALARQPRPARFAMLFADAQGLHATWLSARAAAAALAPTHESYLEALAAGFAPEQLHLTGWPVRAQFLQQSQDRAALLAQLELDPNLFTVFVQGGGEGTAKMVRVVESALAAEVQIMLAAGTNQALQDRFAGAPGLRVIPFTPEIAPYMAAADLVMGKAGPNMLFEAVTLGKPFIASTYIPGQETGNLALIKRYGLGWVALASEEQRNLLAALAAAPQQLEAMAATVAGYRSWNNAALETIGPLLSRLSRSSRPAFPSTPARALSKAPLGGYS